MVQDADLMMIWCRFNDDWRFDVNQQQLIIGTWIGQTIVYPILAIIQWQRLMVLIRALDSKNCFGSGTWDSPSSPWQTPSKVRGEERIPLSSEVRGVLPKKWGIYPAKTIYRLNMLGSNHPKLQIEPARLGAESLRQGLLARCKGWTNTLRGYSSGWQPKYRSSVMYDGMIAVCSQKRVGEFWIPDRELRTSTGHFLIRGVQ